MNTNFNLDHSSKLKSCTKDLVCKVSLLQLPILWISVLCICCVWNLSEVRTLRDRVFHGKSSKAARSATSQNSVSHNFAINLMIVPLTHSISPCSVFRHVCTHVKVIGKINRACFLLTRDPSFHLANLFPNKAASLCT